MALNIKNDEVERLVKEVALMAGETKTEAIRRALLERKDRLALRSHRTEGPARALRYLEREIWPLVPAEQVGRRLSAAEEDAILGYGPDGA